MRSFSCVLSQDPVPQRDIVGSKAYGGGPCRFRAPWPLELTFDGKRWETRRRRVRAGRCGLWGWEVRRCSPRRRDCGTSSPRRGKGHAHTHCDRTSVHSPQAPRVEHVALCAHILLLFSFPDLFLRRCLFERMKFVDFEPRIWDVKFSKKRDFWTFLNAALSSLKGPMDVTFF